MQVLEGVAIPVNLDDREQLIKAATTWVYMDGSTELISPLTWLPHTASLGL